MAGERRYAAFCIGVGQAGNRLPYLQGAINSARGFHAWAIALGYDSRLILDEEDPVTLDRLRTNLENLLQSARTAPIHRLILYFAGHGLIREVEEGLWLLSDWDDELRAVAVEGLRRRLYMYGIKQIAIFADACRNLPSGVEQADLAADPVLGAGPIRKPLTPEIDKFISAQEGSESYVLPGPSPEEDRCIFSGVLLEALWGTKLAAFSTLVPNKITSQSLAAYLRSEVPLVAGRYKIELNPNASPTFSNGDDIYFGESAIPSPPRFSPWPAPETVMARKRPAMSRRKNTGLDFRNKTVGSVINLQTGLGEDFSTFDKFDHISNIEQTSLITRLREQARPSSFRTGSGFAIEGGLVRSVWGPHDIFAGPNNNPNWWRVGTGPTSPLQKPAPIIIEFGNGLYFAGTALPGFIGSVLCDERGASAVVYREANSPADSGTPAEEALAALEKGNLRADSASDYAVQLRQLKHADPVLGVISAYLYDAIGDVDSIRRMAYFYIEHQQPIPYDIALLGQLESHQRDGIFWADVPAVGKRAPQTEAEAQYAWTYMATPDASGSVGGMWPWLRQGWTFLDDPTDAESNLIKSGIQSANPHLQSARFATFNRTGAEILIRQFGLKEFKGEAHDR